MKFCIKCNILKPIEDFRSGKNQCKLCTYTINSEWRKNNKEKKKQADSKYYLDNKEKLLTNNKIYKNSEGWKIKEKEYYILSKNNPSFVIRGNISSLIRQRLKKNNSNKNNDSCLNYLPFTIEELRFHLEKQFEPWMTWDNYGIYNKKLWNNNDEKTWTWQIDHIVPQSTFKYISMKDKEFQECWALENLHPLNSKQNIIDGSNRKRHLK